ncbi:MAG TPA: PQQ-binding-like beta-propeller repeat protein [Gemmatimonadaceae bacterium]|nr:PQQ-binding-like beta-propeller repeat protein [Gemmatimonadaceae bacterium]
MNLRRSAIAIVAALSACRLFDDASADRHVLQWLWRKPNNSTFVNAWSGVPAATDDMAILELPGGLIDAVDATTSATRWYTATLPGSSGATAGKLLVMRGRVLVADGRKVMALDVATGAVLWTYVPRSSTALLYGSADSTAFYVIERDHRVSALDLVTGAERWSVDVDPARQDSTYGQGTAVSGDTVYAALIECQNEYCGFGRGVLIALSASTGAELWRYHAPDNVSDAWGITIVNRLAVVSDTRAGGIYAVDRFTGQRVWSAHGEAGFAGPVVPAAVAGDTLYFGVEDGGIYAVKAETGQNLWSAKVSGGVSGVTVCGDALFALHLAISKLNRHTGEYIGSRGTGDDPDWPSTSGGAVVGDRIVVSGPGATWAYSCRL